MATRRSSSTKSSNPTTDETPVSTDTTEETSMTESTVEATSTESTVETPAEAVTETAAETKVEVPIDLTAFNAAVAEAVAEADTSTGDVSPAHMEPITKAYREIDGIKGKNAAKNAVNELMKDAMNSGNLPVARAYLSISEKALVAAAGGSSSAPKAPADPTEAFVLKVTTLNLAYNLATGAVPEGVDASAAMTKVNEQVAAATEQVTTYTTWLDADEATRGDEPEVPAFVKNAVKLANGKSAKAGASRGGSTFTGDRRDVGKHILNAFADQPEGKFLKIAEIRNIKSEEYGDDLPSAGAISARLFPKSGKESSMVAEGIKPDTQDGSKGAVKVAV